jgi:DNA invertase Pin-like site-specific DNA recombinase
MVAADHLPYTNAGEGSAKAKLTFDQVREIRARYAAGGVRQLDLAAEFGVGRSTVAQILTRKTWKEPRGTSSRS